MKRWLLPVLLLALGCTRQAPDGAGATGPTASAPGDNERSRRAIPLEAKVVEKDALPDGWRLNEIARAAHPSAVTANAHVLAWKQMVDDRSILLEECLVLVDLPRADASDRWVLSCVSRQQGNGWEVAILHMGPGYKGSPTGAWVLVMKSFTKRPSNKEVYRFADGFMWRFAGAPGWKLLSAQVCKQTWEEVLKEKPSRDFPKDK